MAQKNSSKIISVVHPFCCRLDVLKDMVSACIIITEPDEEENNRYFYTTFPPGYHPTGSIILT